MELTEGNETEADRPRDRQNDSVQALNSSLVRRVGNFADQFGVQRNGCRVEDGSYHHGSVE